MLESQFEVGCRLEVVAEENKLPQHLAERKEPTLRIRLTPPPFLYKAVMFSVYEMSLFQENLA